MESQMRSGRVLLPGERDIMRDRLQMLKAAQCAKGVPRSTQLDEVYDAGLRAIMNGQADGYLRAMRTFERHMTSPQVSLVLPRRLPSRTVEVAAVEEAREDALVVDIAPYAERRHERRGGGRLRRIGKVAVAAAVACLTVLGAAKPLAEDAPVAGPIAPTTMDESPVVAAYPESRGPATTRITLSEDEIRITKTPAFARMVADPEAFDRMVQQPGLTEYLAAQEMEQRQQQVVRAHEHTLE